MLKVPTSFNRFVSDGLDRCKYCQHVLYHVNDYVAVCLNCGSYFDKGSKFKPTSLFDDTCSADPRGKDDHEI